MQPTNRETPIESLRPHRTAVGRFFVREHFPPRRIARKDWRLDVEGAVESPRQYSESDLDRAPRRTVIAALECAGNGRNRFGRTVSGEIAWGDGAVSSAMWEGVPLRWFLDQAGVACSAREVVVSGSDGASPAPRAPSVPFARSLPIEVAARRSDILIALRMNGRPLPHSHGAPARLVVPGWYAMASVKWVRRIEVVTGTFDGYFQSVKYVYRRPKSAADPVREVRVKAIVTDPGPSARLPLGRVATLRGKSWTGHGRVVRVEVNVGGGWADARLTPGLDEYDWSEWEFRWRPHTAGTMRIRVRATDSSGARQPERPIANRYQYAHNAIQSIEVKVVGR
ncbi:MAG: molybdopterin-dependent oxidoreductase [Thermoplasmata archaeon]|nr:molybdopterin-dependent oxidoreductase [Thermoplasmata archaeon]MCI4359843.1 molybdopterin-dependent oxidoreductase [Thermoplasmata archaeon]